MISGECRVDAIPPSGGDGAGHRLSIDGLRLRLDLRIVPGPPGADGTAAAVWRIEEAATLPLFALPFHVPAAFRRAAVVSSLVVLGLAVVVWFAGGPHTPWVAAPEAAAPAAAPARPPVATATRAHPPAAGHWAAPTVPKPPEQAPAAKVEPVIAPWGAAPAAGAAPSAPARAESAEGVAPRIRALPPSAPGREAGGVMANEPAAPSAGVPSAVSPGVRSDARRPEAARAPAPGPGRSSDAPARTADAQRDLLELFGDTK